MIFKNIKVKLYPTIKQKEVLDNHFNAYRFCYIVKNAQWRYAKRFGQK